MSRGVVLIAGSRAGAGRAQTGPAGAPGAPGAPGDAGVAADDPAVAGGTQGTTDPTAPKTKGLKLATGSTEKDDKGSTPDGAKAVLYTIAGSLVLGTGAWSYTTWAAQAKARRVKAF